MPLRAQSHAYAKFMRPLAHRIRNDAVNANHGQKQSKCGEGARQHEYEPAALQRPRDDLVHGHYTDGLVAIPRFVSTRNSVEKWDFPPPHAGLSPRLKVSV